MNVKSLEASRGTSGKCNQAEIALSFSRAEGVGSQSLAYREFLGHVKQELALRLFDVSHQAAELMENPRILTGTAPGNVVRRPAFGKVRKFGRFFTVVKELIEWNFESACEFFERLNGRYSVAIFNARNVASQQTCAFFDVPLRKLFFLAQSAKTVANNHVGN